MTETNVVEPGTLSDSDSGRRTFELIDLGAIWLAFRRRVWLFVIGFLVAFAAVVAAYVLITREYTATAEVQVDTTHQQVTSSDAVVQSDKTDTFAVETQVQVLQSPELARRVAEKLDLWRDPDFVPAPKGPAPTKPQAIAIAASTLLSNLLVKRSGLAFVIDVSYTDPSATRATKIANTLVQEYTANLLDTKVSVTQRAGQFLDSQLSELRVKAENADRALANFQAAHPMLNSGADQTATQSEMSAMNGQFADAQADLAQKRAALSAARSGIFVGSGNGTVGGSISRSAVPELRSQEAQTAQKVADLQSRYGSQYPEYKAAQQQLAAIRSQIQAETQRNIADLSAQVSAAEGRAGSLAASRARVGGTLVGNTAARGQLETLQREASTAGTTYEQALQRYRDISAQQGSQTADSRILALAQVPTKPSSPNLVLFALAALVAGVLAGTIAVVARELMERGVRTSSDVRETFGLRTLATIPDFRSALSPEERSQYRSLNEFYIVDHPFSAFTESVRMLHASLMRPRSGERNQVVALTSALPGEGKSTCATCLTRVAAMGGQRAVLLECDTRRKNRSGLAAETENGLLELLEGKVTLDQALRQDATTGAYILPLSRKHLAPSQVLTDNRLEALLAELRNRFDLIVMDTAPVLPIAETRLLVTRADVVAYLVRWGSTPKGASLAGARMIKESGGEIGGVVLTRVNLAQQAKWTRDDASSYYGQYKNYYH